MQFGLYGVASAGSPVVTLLTNAPVAVSNGLFTTTLDFGAGAFDGSPLWLEIGVRTNGSASAYLILTPRQLLTPAPYAITAGTITGTLPNAGLAGNYPNAVTSNNAGNSFTGNGAGLTGLNAGNLASGTVSDARLSGNVALLNGNNAFTGSNNLSGLVVATNNGNLISGTLAGNLTGNVTGNLVGNAATATTANNFSGSLAGDVTGTQGATVVAMVGGQSAANVAGGTVAANAATSANMPGTIVQRDGSGNFSAGAITAASLSGNGSGLSSLSASQLSSGTVSDARLSANVALLNANNGFTGSNNLSGVTVATNTGNVINGAFTGPLAGNVTGNVTGNLSGNATTATTAGNFTGSLSGDVTGTQGATVVSSVGGQSAANVANGANAANGATSANTGGSIVKRDGSGNFAAGAITVASVSGNGAGLTSLNPLNLSAGTAGIDITGNAATANNFTGNLAGDVTGTQGTTLVASVGGQSAANVAGGASAANAATSANAANTIVKRDASGNFSAGAITAGSVSGDGSGLTNLNGANLVSGSVSATQLGAGAAVANLQASGQSGVASGGIVFSTNVSSATLTGAGFVRMGKTVLGVDTWDQGANMPLAGRDLCTAVWTGIEMIIWGGASYNGSNICFGDGARYNPALNTWTATGTNGAPSPRYAHAAVWTGTEMIIWGGYDPTNQSSFGNGARYNPQSDSWTPVSSVGAPSARFGHTATWTGTEMVVWGGVDYTGSNHLNFSDGARYNPTLDTWTPMATNSLLAGRYLQTAVWTGSKVIVWGGTAVYNATNSSFGDGALYDPVLDSWTATSTNGAPSPRYEHTAVWTGTEMIVWGGYSVTGVHWFGDGARYNPVTDTWTATTATAAPAARYDHTAVWTGTEMIIWGGYGGSYLNTGGRYNPSSDSWQVTTSTGAPGGREVPMAVWDGAEMIVCAGQNATTYFNDTFTYTPPTTLYLYVKP